MSDTEPCPVRDEITDYLGVQFWFLTNTNALNQHVAPSQEIMQEAKFLADVKKQTATISQLGHADRSVNRESITWTLDLLPFPDTVANDSHVAQTLRFSSCFNLSPEGKSLLRLFFVFFWKLTWYSDLTVLRRTKKSPFSIPAKRLSSCLCFPALSIKRFAVMPVESVASTRCCLPPCRLCS